MSDFFLTTPQGNNIRVSGATLVGISAATPTFVAVTDGLELEIPIGAFRWSFTLLTGTATIGGLPVLAGFSDWDDAPILVAIPIVIGTPGTGYLRFMT